MKQWLPKLDDYEIPNLREHVKCETMFCKNTNKINNGRKALFV